MSSSVRLGAFVAGALIIFAVMVFLLGDKEFLFSHTYSVNAPFDNVVGLDVSAPVRAGGVRIGTVKSIELPRRPQDKITVQMDLESSTRDVIKQDSVATIETEGLLGNKYVAISFGSPDAAAVHNGDTIQAQPPVDYGDLAKKASDLMDATQGLVQDSKIAMNNVNETTDDLKSISGKIDRGQGTIGALVNDQSVYRNLNATLTQAQAGVAAFQDDMEALKHNFLLRGFFKKRGYFDQSDLTKYAVARLPNRAPSKRFDFNSSELFGKPDSLKLSKDKELSQAGDFLKSNSFDMAVVVASGGGSKDDNATMAEARAFAVRKYLAEKFKIDESRLKTLGGSAQASEPTGKISIVVYAGTH